MCRDQYIAIILAAGQGSRMNSDIAKQYMRIYDKPMLYYSLAAFDRSEVDRIIVVVGNDEIEYCKKEIVEKYHIRKECTVISGGAERYLSVNCALTYIAQNYDKMDSQCYVLIHDAARPLITEQIIATTIDSVRTHEAVAVGVPSKDTIKIINEEGVIEHTPKRSLTYNIQTPQAFKFELIKNAYEVVMLRTNLEITDDAMIVENGCDKKVHVVVGDYTNIKVTTPEDIKIAELLMSKT